VCAAVNSTLQLTGFLQFAVRQTVETENNMAAVERLSAYLNVQTEAPLTVAHSPAPEGWPRTGAIEFRALQLRYRPDLPLVLRGLTCSIKPQEKVGICGRSEALLSLISLVPLIQFVPHCAELVRASHL
jgi:ABC-type multidrug transport system fused ATPase/permease subunit